jgi:uroporphyrinogen-III synthase
MCRNVAALLARKSPPQEAEEYKKWVMDVSAKVANAAAEEGQKVSPAEQATMNEIAQAINTTPSSAG